MDELEEVCELLKSVPNKPGQELPGGIGRSAIQDFAKRSGFEVPEVLFEWLGRCNGPLVGPGGLFGLGTSKKFLDMEHLLSLFPSWRRQNWIPVAGDGNGNYYVLTRARGRWPVVFIETSTDSDVAAFVVASDLPKFLKALLSKEGGKNVGWPFKKSVVLANDPDISYFGEDFPLPWDA